MIKKLITKKNKGVSDLIASLVAIVGLITVSVIMINVIADVYTRTQLDQVARKYILMLEASDIKDYTDTITNIKADLMDINAVQEGVALAGEGMININISPAAGSRKYGDELTLEIKVPISRVNFFYTSNGENQGHSTENLTADNGGTQVNGSFGKIRRNIYSIAIVRKETTIKY